jgi:hypothetical protein
MSRTYDFVVTTEPRVGTEIVYATHNYSDPTTWFGSSVRVEAEAAADSGNGLTWLLANSPIIDLTHGKIFDEKTYITDQQTENPGDPHGYALEVRVDGVLQTARAPFATTGGDYTADYASGQIVFTQSQAGKEVTVDYSYATDSGFIIRPDPGFDLDIEKVKAMWSDDFVMNDTVQFQVYGLAEILAPQLGLPLGTKIPIQTTDYDSLLQLVSEASGYTPFAVPATGGGVRGLPSPLHSTEFRYGTIRRLSSMYGLELHVRLKNDLANGGAVSTATFYCVLRPSAATA